MKFSLADIAEPVRAKIERKRMLAVLGIGSDVLLVSGVKYRRIEKENLYRPAPAPYNIITTFARASLDTGSFRPDQGR